MTLDQALARLYTDHERKHIKTLITNHPDYTKAGANALVPEFGPCRSPSDATKSTWVRLAIAYGVLETGLANAYADTQDALAADLGYSAAPDMPEAFALPDVQPMLAGDSLKSLGEAILEPISTLIAPALVTAVSDRVQALLEAARLGISQAKGQARRNAAPVSSDELHGNVVNLPQTIGSTFDFTDKAMASSPFAKLPVDIWQGSGCNAVIDSDFLHDPETTGQLAVYVNAGLDCFLHGPRGTGKSETVEQIAARLRRHYTAIQFSKDMDKYELIGTKLPVTKPDGSKSFEFAPGLLARAISIPGNVIALEELSAAPPDFGFVIQNLMSSRRLVVESGEVIECADGVVFVATDNTGGFGDTTGHYHGTYTMNGALVDRFAHKIEARRLSQEELARIARRRTGLDIKVCKDLVSYQLASEKLADTQALSISLSLRRTLAFARALQAGVPGPMAFTSAFTLHLPPEEQATFVSYALTNLPNPQTLADTISRKGI